MSGMSLNTGFYQHLLSYQQVGNFALGQITSTPNSTSSVTNPFLTLDLNNWTGPAAGIPTGTDLFQDPYKYMASDTRLQLEHIQYVMIGPGSPLNGLSDFIAGI